MPHDGNSNTYAQELVNFTSWTKELEESRMRCRGEWRFVDQNKDEWSQTNLLGILHLLQVHFWDYYISTLGNFRWFCIPCKFSLFIFLAQVVLY